MGNELEHENEKRTGGPLPRPSTIIPQRRPIVALRCHCRGAIVKVVAVILFEKADFFFKNPNQFLLLVAPKCNAKFNFPIVLLCTLCANDRQEAGLLYVYISTHMGGGHVGAFPCCAAL